MEILFVAAVIPVIFLGWYIYKKDNDKEPSKLLAKIFGFGALTVIPGIILELIAALFFPTSGISDFIMLFINVALGIAVIEEGLKWVVTYFFGYKNGEFDELYDVIVYSVFASLGFACIENIGYVFQHGLGNAIMRAITSIPGHTCFGVLMGYYLAKAKLNSVNGNNSLQKRNMILSIVVPTLFHTVYDTVIMYAVATSNGFYTLVFYAFHIFEVIFCFKIIKKSSAVQNNIKLNIKNGNLTYNEGSGFTVNPSFSTVNNQNTVNPSFSTANNQNTVNNSQVNSGFASNGMGNNPSTVNNTPSINNGMNNQGQFGVNFCPVCGRPSNGNNFCPGCGYKLK